MKQQEHELNELMCENVYHHLLVHADYIPATQNLL
jgi:hypothetical protein